jgi:hypothetical protein
VKFWFRLLLFSTFFFAFSACAVGVGAYGTSKWAEIEIVLILLSLAFLSFSVAFIIGYSFALIRAGKRLIERASDLQSEEDEDQESTRI